MAEHNEGDQEGSGAYLDAFHNQKVQKIQGLKDELGLSDSDDSAIAQLAKSKGMQIPIVMENELWELDHGASMQQLNKFHDAALSNLHFQEKALVFIKGQKA